MSISIKKGDLFQSKWDVLIHQANCFQTMNAGIAKQIRIRYPEAYFADQNDLREPHERLGSFSYGYHQLNNQYIINLYAQYDYGRSKRYTDYDALSKSLQSFSLWINTIDPFCELKIALPYHMGCGLAGGDWNIVYDLIHREFDSSNRQIDIYQL